MGTSAVRFEALVVGVSCSDVALRVELADGREIVAQRANWRPIGGGVGIHWPDLDEDLSVAGLLATH